MTMYADPSRCPDCRVLLHHAPQACHSCSLPLTGDTVDSLFATLTEADRLLGVLRTQKAPVPVTLAPSATAGSPLAGAQHYPAPAKGPERDFEATFDRPRLPGASVPGILLSLGALCLLVAAITFLAVAWAWLGVGGRTGVLVFLTGVALGQDVAGNG